MNAKLEKLLRQRLVEAERQNTPSTVVAYHRIDGPGSSQDLPEFQESLWKMPSLPRDFENDPALEWSNGLPRTVGITISSGTRVTAHPCSRDRIAAKSESKGCEFDVSAHPGDVPLIKENWPLKIMEIFGLQGVKFLLKNTNENTLSSGLGGSATAITAVCILANELTGRPFNGLQLISLASRIEQNFRVSITGTQEQSNVVYGGVTDHVWLPWGLPRAMSSLGQDAGFGTSLRREIVAPEDYDQLEQRLCIFHSGKTHFSGDVNAVWLNALSVRDGYRLHRKMLPLAYQFREGLRLRNWETVLDSIDAYRRIRTELCGGYMTGTEEIQSVAEVLSCASFPLGAGGGGATFIFGPETDRVLAAKKELAKRGYNEISVRIRETGHECSNLEEVTEMWNTEEIDEDLQTTLVEKEFAYE